MSRHKESRTTHYHFYGAPGGAPADVYNSIYGTNPATGVGQANGAYAQPNPFPGGYGANPPAPAAFGPVNASGQVPYGMPFSGPAAVNRHRHPAADSLVKGLAVGAGAAYLLSNETAQRFLLRSAAQLWTFLRRGAEEIKEKFQDAEAEVESPLEVEGTGTSAPEVPPASAGHKG